MGGCFWLFLQARKGNIYFTELAGRVEHGNYGPGSEAAPETAPAPAGPTVPRRTPGVPPARCVSITVPNATAIIAVIIIIIIIIIVVDTCIITDMVHYYHYCYHYDDDNNYYYHHYHNYFQYH